MDKNPKIIAESALNGGVKFVALDDMDDLFLLKYTDVDDGDF